MAPRASRPPAAAPAAPGNRFTLAWSGDIPRLRTWLDGHALRYDLTHWGSGPAFRATVRQLHRGRVNQVTIRVGDSLVLDEQLLAVEKRPVRKRMPPPGGAYGSVRRPRRDGR